VVRPSLQTFATLKSEMWTIPSDEGGDQGFLNIFFKKKWHKLDHSYNVMTKIRQMYYPSWNGIKNIAKVLHYSPAKPWRDLPCCQKSRLEILNRLWWKYFENLLRNPTVAEYWKTASQLLHQSAMKPNKL